MAEGVSVGGVVVVELVFKVGVVRVPGIVEGGS